MAHSRSMPVLSASVAAITLALQPFGSAMAASAYAEGPLLAIVRTMPEGGWQQVNANSFSAAWPPRDLWPAYKSGFAYPDKIVRAWSSFAWDSARGDLIMYGGGHANSNGNDVYRWRSRTLRWERASLSSEMELLNTYHFLPVDGVHAAPQSAHTYDNSLYLPVSDRYMTFGGATADSGGQYVMRSEADPSVLRYTGPYLFDPARAHPDKVGGTTGSHVQRVAPYPDIVGGNMWQNRDIYAHVAFSGLPQSHVNGCTAYSNEMPGRDVIYVAARTNAKATGLELYRYQVNDLLAPENDSFERVGRFWSSPSAQTTCAYDPDARIVLRTGTNTSPFHYWDVAAAGNKNYEHKVLVDGSVSEFVEHLNSIGRQLHLCAMDYDPKRAAFLVWCGAGDVWRVTPPVPLAPQGWQVNRIGATTNAAPPDVVGVGILGKWKYVPGFDVFIGMSVDVPADGNLWVYKPAGWIDPGGSAPVANQSPTVSLLAPLAGAVLTAGSATSLRVNAADSDGQVVKVVYRAGGAVVGSATSAPFTLTWTPTVPGVVGMTAEAVDDKGASTISAQVLVTVNAPAVNVPPVVSLTQPAAGSSHQVSQTVHLAVSANDSDGHVTRVVYKANGNIIATATSAPFTANWRPTAVGALTLTAEATDDDGAVTASLPIKVTISADTPTGQTVVLGRGGVGTVADTYLSAYHKTSNFGGSTATRLWRDNYIPLVRFAIFASEGGPVPDGATIESARLRVWKGAYGQVIDLHAMLVPWVENQATWNRPRVGNEWHVPGAAGAGQDYVATADARVSALWESGWVEFDVTARVAQFAAKALTNNGWRLRFVAGGTATFLTFASSEAVVSQPELEIVWRQ